MGSKGLELVKTGIPGLDEIIGGFYRGQTILVMGNAGSGKTTFCAKFVYEGAKRFGEPGLYINTVESKEEFYTYMRNLGMDFEELEKKGLFRYVEMLTPTSEDALMEFSRKLISNAMEIGAKRIVIDSITPLLMLGDPLKARAILHNAIKTVTRQFRAILLITEEVPREGHRHHAVEEFIADGIIRLRLEVPDAGAPRRIMEILKLRGRPIQRVMYDFELGPPHGIRVFTTRVIEVLESNIDARLKVPTGVEGLDKMLGGGIIRNTTALIVGPPGSGKTLLMLTMAATNALRGEKVVYVSFEEPRQQIRETLRFLRYDPDELSNRGLAIYAVNPRAVTLREVHSILTSSEMSDATIFMVDGLYALYREFGSDFHKVVRDVALEFKKKNVTTVLSMVARDPGEPMYLSTVADTIIELSIREINNELKRYVKVVKARISEALNQVKEIKLVNRRLVVV